MGYGEYGGDGSVQVTNLLSKPNNGNSQMVPNGRAGWTPASVANPSRLSARAQAIYDALPPGQSGVNTSIGLDQVGSPSELGQFAVTVNFQSNSELATASQAFQTASSSGASSVTFNVNILANSPGQIQISWPDA